MQLGVSASLGATATSGVEQPSLVTNAKSIAFDGTDDHVNLGNNWSFLDDPDANEFTIVAWFKGASGADGTIFGKAGADVNTERAVQFFTDGNDFGYGRLGNTHLSTGVTVADGTWHHAALVSWNDGGTYKGTVYIDGVARVTASTGSGTQADKDFLIGARRNTNNTDLGYLFTGNIDEVGIWNSALTATEIKAIYDNVRLDFTKNSVGYASSSSLAGWWRMGDGTTTSDSTTLSFPFVIDSKTTTLGPELVVDGSSNWVGNFDVSGDVSSWTNQDDTKITLSHDSGTSGLKIEAESDGKDIYAYFTATVEVGEKYRITADRVGGNGTTGAIRVGRTVGGTQYWNQYISNPVGDEEEGTVFTAAVNTTCIIALKTNANSTYIIFNNISLKKITAGNIGIMTNMVSGDIESDVPS